jgi:hypothetical protein
LGEPWTKEAGMELRLHLLEKFVARGSDGAEYKVCAYERMTRDPSMPQADDCWEPTGQTEFRLEDGRPLLPHNDGTMDLQQDGAMVHLTPERVLH